MTTAEARRLVRLIRVGSAAPAKKKTKKASAESMQILIDAKIYDRNGKLTKPYRSKR
jgi:hypothetical protein